MFKWLWTILSLGAPEVWEPLAFVAFELHRSVEAFFIRSVNLCWKFVGKIGSFTFLLGADQRLSGEGVFNGIYYCPLGFRARYTCISYA